ncbi:hyperpolarization-activated (Ih) channel [Strongylocentrotus purpuratus]|uniref:Hyperpolarization-activated (Ih) channel n=1 Tax=Strongylocentrotus purpuratus TaxID=7668 RepID=O76977_STRPU|nr:hyperpolarization-activated (Ih) channel [Strongylocentrotus purpuratus]CAA76493.1 hyperpolarization-activated (Ih) channel [Strongylocentrotus purpuratus]|eukprot:NP_999729.1 hyperpolarization-activated (Ih) channel [Strongylocentrotus purpuratus]
MDNKETNGELEQSDEADPSGQNLDDGETDSKQEENLINVSPPKTPPGPPPPLKNGGRGQKPPKIPICHQNGKLPKEVEWTEDRGEDRKDSLTLQSKLDHGAYTDEKQDLLTYLDRHGINSPVKLTPDETGGSSALDILGIIEERDTGALGSDPSSTMQAMAKPVGFLQRQLWTVLQPSDNRLSMKLFGSKKGLQKEKYRLRKAGVLIIHPCSHFRFYWDLLMLCLIMANVILLPVVITFFHNKDMSTGWLIFNCFSDTFFILDLICNFRTGIMNPKSAEQVILNPRQIAYHYLRSWFIIDLVSSIPMDYIFLLAGGQNRHFLEVSRALKILRFAKLLSLLRLLRLSRLMRFVSQWEQAFNVANAVIRICNLVCMMLLIGHWNGCLQYLVPMLQEYPDQSWVAINGLEHAHWWEQYTWALFKALSHMLCIGYGKFPPQSITDVWLTIVSMVSGATCFALFIGHATNLIQSMDSSSRQYREKLKQVEEYMQYRKLPSHLRNKILDYYEYRYRGKMFDERHIFREVSESIRQDVANYNCRDLVASVPFFVGADSNFVTRVVTLLEFEVFQPADYVIQEGTFGDRMFFIQQGIVDIIMSDGVIATSLSDGSYFGEICLLTRERRVASVKCETYCTLFSLSVQHFNQVLDEFPAMRKTMEEIAVRRLTRIGKESSKLKSRLESPTIRDTAPLFPIPPDTPSFVTDIEKNRFFGDDTDDVHIRTRVDVERGSHENVIAIMDGSLSDLRMENEIQARKSSSGKRRKFQQQTTEL